MPGDSMKKVLLPLTIFIAIVAVGGIVWQFTADERSVPYGPESVIDDKAAGDASNSAQASSGEPRTGVVQSTYGQYAATFQADLASGEPVAIERFVELVGACESVQVTLPNAQPDRDFARMREFCDGYTSGMQPIDLAEMWESGLTAELDQRMADLKASSGQEAVGRELSKIVKDGNAYEKRAALQYAANNAIIPEHLRETIANSSNGGRLSQQLDALSYVEFCRSGGDCGSNDFETLRACVALGPCKPGDGLLDVIRRQASPRDFEAAMEISRDLGNASSASQPARA